MNYSTLIFRKDTTGLAQYFDCVRRTSVLMQKCIDRDCINVDGVSYIEFEGHLIPEFDVRRRLDKLFDTFDSKLGRGYDIGKIVKDNGMYSLGAFPEDYKNFDYSTSGFNSGSHSEPKSRFTMNGGMVVIEMYDNGSIVTDLENNARYFYSNKDVEFLRSQGKFIFDFEFVAVLNCGLAKRNEEFELVDGLGCNRMASNIAKVRKYGYQLGKSFLGYEARTAGDRARHRFLPQCWFGGHRYSGRECDNEVEAVCEAWRVEDQVAGKGHKDLFNPVKIHRSNEGLVEQYVKGEITELGMEGEVLHQIARNPFLVLRFRLVKKCRKMCIPIAPFALDSEGYMVNADGVRYSEMALREWSWTF